MNNNSTAIFSLGIGAVVMLLVSVAVYKLGGIMAEKFIFGDAQTLGIQVPMLADWKEAYYYIVQDTGVAVGIVLLIWTALTHWVLHSEDSINKGKRTLWVFFGIIVAAMCVVIPFLWAEFFSETIAFDSSLLTDERILLLFFVFYGLIGYWGGSIFVTSNRYKYTPLLAHFFR